MLQMEMIYSVKQCDVVEDSGTPPLFSRGNPRHLPPMRPTREHQDLEWAGPSIRRREFLKVAGAGALLLGAGGSRWPRGSLDAARAAGAWIRAVARETPHGLTWPVVPSESEADVQHLYSGAPGVILFLLELHHATGEDEYLREAEAGARHLLAVTGTAPGTPQLPDWGLYTGLSGVAYTLWEVHAAGGDAEIGRGARDVVRRVMEASQPMDGGLAWYSGAPDEASYDLISGSAGIGLTLLWFHDRWVATGEEALASEALEVARGAGRLLATRGRAEEDGLKWPLSEAYPRLMPNFSHGTAGVAYFLARLHEVTGEADFLRPAIAGARYLERVSTCEAGRGCLVFHHEPGGEDLFYLGWCHGPVGTGRLFQQLARVTGEGGWLNWLREGARGIRAKGVPKTRTEGYWNNVSQCCGDAGVGDFFLSLYALGGAEADLAFARRLGAYLLEEATEESGRARWIQAENRTEPENVVAQTGWMQGAAGVGAFFLHLDGAETARRARVVFPDSPWQGLL
jgi:lantibiotic modifying enzyme